MEPRKEGRKERKKEDRQGDNDNGKQPHELITVPPYADLSSEQFI